MIGRPRQSDAVSSYVRPGRPNRLRTMLASAPLAYAGMVVLALLPLAPALLLPYLPTVDGPAHVYEGYVLAHYGSPDAAVLRRYYVLSAAPSPNLLTELLLAGLLRILSPGVSEKLFAVGDVSLFAVGVTYAVRSVDRRQTFLAALAAPLATGYLFYFGFYNFCVGVGLSLFVVGFFLRCRDNWTLARSIALLLLLVVTASAHLLPFGMAALAIAATVLADLFATVRRDGPGKRGLLSALAVTARREAIAPLSALVPPSVLAVVFLLRSSDVHGATQHKPQASADPGAGGGSPFSLRHLARVTIGQVTVYSWVELALGLLLLGTITLLLLLSVSRRPRPASAPLQAFVGMVLVCAGLYAAFPDTLGTLAFISARFALFAILFALLALAAVPPRRGVRTAAVLVAGLSALALPLARAGPQRHYSADLREYASAAAVLKPGSTFVTLRAWYDASPLERHGYDDPTSHQASRVAMASRTIQLNHLDGRYDYFPAHFRQLDRLGARSSDLDQPALWLRLLAESKAPGATRLDYVLVWGRNRVEAATRVDPAYGQALRELNAAYRRIWVSQPQGLLEVYERRYAQ